MLHRPFATLNFGSMVLLLLLLLGAPLLVSAAPMLTWVSGTVRPNQTLVCSGSGLGNTDGSSLTAPLCTVLVGINGTATAIEVSRSLFATPPCVGYVCALDPVTFPLVWTLSSLDGPSVVFRHAVTDH
jgi:hypothetical protein